MARKQIKKRPQQGAHPGVAPAPGNAPSKPGSRNPKSMVIRIGAAQVGPSVTRLVHDVRTVLEPQTAVRLRERRTNKLRDYTAMAGPLGVTHLLLFSKSEKRDGSGSGNVNLRLAVTPRGPTMHFRVEGYSLCKDVMKAQRRPRSAVKGEFLAPPLLVMNNFTTKDQEGDGEKKKKDSAVPKHLESLATTVFQSLFPPINPTHTPLKSIKRVLLLDRQTASPSSAPDSDSVPYVLNLRHYAIETRTAKSVPKPLRRLDAAERTSHAGQKRKRGDLPNLGKLEDVADYLLDPQAADGFTSGSESEPETDAEVEVLAASTQKVKDRRGRKESGNPEDVEEGNDDGTPRPERRNHTSRPAPGRVERKGVKMHELGPRLKLRLTKVEEGLCGGKVMWHEYIHKSDAEIKEMEKVHQERQAERERRKQQQRENVERKKKERQVNGGGNEEEDGEEMDEDDDQWDDYDDDVMEDVDGEGEGPENEDEDIEEG